MDNYEIANVLSGRGWIANSPIDRGYANMLSYCDNGSSFYLPVVVINSERDDFQCDFYDATYFTRFGLSNDFKAMGGDVRALPGFNFSVSFVHRKPLLFGVRDSNEGELVTKFAGNDLVYITRNEAFEEIANLRRVMLE